MLEVTIIDLQIYGIDTVRLFIIEEIRFYLIDVKISDSKNAIKKYIYVQELFSCMFSEISIYNMTIINTNILFG